MPESKEKRPWFQVASVITGAVALSVSLVDVFFNAPEYFKWIVGLIGLLIGVMTATLSSKKQ